MTFEPDHGASPSAAPPLWRRTWDRVRSWRPGLGRTGSATAAAPGGVSGPRNVVSVRPGLRTTSPVRVGEGGVWLPLSVSVGLAPWRPAEDFDAAVALADAALYQAKGAGRNRVQVARAAA